MRHRRKTVKLQRDAAHRRALLANLVVSLIEHGQIKTTLAKAKAVRPFAEKMVTLGKRDDVHSRRLAHGYLHSDAAVKTLFGKIAPAAKGRNGGYTRITKLGQRHTDSAPMAFIEWVDQATEEAAPQAAAPEEKTEAPAAPAKKTKPKAAQSTGEGQKKAAVEGEKKAPAKKKAKKEE